MALQNPKASSNYLQILLIRGILGLNALAVVALFSLYSIFVYFPKHYAESFWSEQWLAQNVNVMDFQGLEQFKTAQESLRSTIFSPQEASNPIPRLLIADLFEMAGKHSGAAYFYRDALAITESNWLYRQMMRPLSDHAHEKLAVIYYEENRKLSSLQEIQQLGDLETHAENPELLSTLQECLQNQQRAEFHLQLAMEFRNALKLNLADQELRQTMQLGGSPALQLKAQAFQNFELPKEPGAITPMARYYLLAGNEQSRSENLKGAAQFYKKATQEDPRFEWAYNALANTLQQMGQYSQAAQNARVALTLNPSFYHPHLVLGDIAMSQANYHDAIAHYQNGQSIMSGLPVPEIEPQAVNVENQLAYAFEQIKEYKQANRHYSQALAVAQQSEQDFESEYEYALAGLRRIQGK